MSDKDNTPQHFGYEPETIVIDREEEENNIKEPSKYKVVMLNDDYTPMDWVVWALEAYFGHTMEAALDIMMQVHTTGKGVAGIYSKDIAETKSMLINHVAQYDGHPFQTIVEEE